MIHVLPSCEEAMKRAAPGTADARLTTFSEQAYAARALGGGATGFLLKSGAPYELFAGVRTVAGCAAFHSPKVARCVFDGLGGDDGRLGRVAAALVRNRLQAAIVAYSDSHGQRCKDRDRERPGRVPSGPPPREDEQRGEQQQSGLRPHGGGVLYPREGGTGEVGGVPIEAGVPEAHGHGP